MKIRVVLLVSVLMLAVGCSKTDEPLTVVSKQSAASEPIKLGGLFSYTAAPHIIGPAQQATQLAVAEANAAGGVLGRPVELIIRDDLGDPGKALLVAEDLLIRDKVDVLLGQSLSHVAIALGGLAKKNQVPYFTVWASDNNLTWSNGHDYIFVIEPPPALYAKALAEVAAKHKLKRWVTVAPNFAYGRSVVGAFKEELTALQPGVEFVVEQWPGLKQFDAGPTVQAMVAGKPDAVLNVLFSANLSAYIREASLRGLLEATHFHSYLGAQEEIDFLGDQAPQGWYTLGFPSFEFEGADYLKFVERFQAKFGERPNFSALLSYINAKFVLGAIKTAGSADKQAIAKAAKGLTIDTPVGQVNMRAIDHRSTLGYWFGQIGEIDGHPTLINAERMDVNAYSPSDEWIMQSRAKN